MRLNHVTVGAADVERSAGFYRRLGFEQIVASYPHYARFKAPDGDATLSLAHAPDGVPRSATSVHLECEDVDATVERLKAAGVEFDLDPVDQPYLWREAILRDPDGNVLFLFTAGENRLNPPWRL